MGSRVPDGGPQTGRVPAVSCPSCGRGNRVHAGAAGYPHCGACGASLPWLVDSGEADFGDVALQSPVPVLVDLWAPWCGPCRVVSPMVERVGGELAGRLKVVKVDVDEAPAISQRFGVRGIPTLVLLAGGRERDRLVGAPPSSAALRSWVEERLG
jgi:thioredoxin 2